MFQSPLRRFDKTVRRSPPFQFNTLDTNGSGTITYEAMRMGLANLGTYSDVNYLMRQVSAPDYVVVVVVVAAAVEWFRVRTSDVSS